MKSTTCRLLCQRSDSVVCRPSSVFRLPSDPGCRPSSVVWRLASAFTLVELLVVIVIIAILAGITLPLARYAIRRANEARQAVMMAKIYSALDDYRATYGEYPITPPANSADVFRHYPASPYPTLDAVQSNSTFTTVSFNTNTVEMITDVHSNQYLVDYCLTYPLMFKQLDKGARPFMVFPIVDVVYLVTIGDEATPWYVWRRAKGGQRQSVEMFGVYGDAVHRAKAIDPVSGCQWDYVCTNGINYTITTNGF